MCSSALSRVDFLLSSEIARMTARQTSADIRARPQSYSTFLGKGSQDIPPSAVGKEKFSARRPGRADADNPSSRPRVFSPVGPQARAMATLEKPEPERHSLERESQVWFTLLDHEYQSAMPVKWKDLKGKAQDEAMVFRPGEGAITTPTHSSSRHA